MPRIILLWAQLLVFCCYFAYPEQRSPSQMSIVLLSDQLPDSAKVNRLNDLARGYLQEQAFDSVQIVSAQAIKISEKIGHELGLSVALANMAKVHYMKGDYTPALSSVLKSLRLSEAINNRGGVAVCLNVIGLIHLAQGQRETSLVEFKKAATLNSKIGDKYRLSTNYFNMGLAYSELKLSDSALIAFKKAMDISIRIKHLNMQAMASNRLGDTYFKRNQVETAIRHYMSVLNNKSYQNDWENSFAYTGLAQCYEKQQMYDQAISYAHRGLRLAEKKRTRWDAKRAFEVLHRSYAQLNKNKEAYKYLLLEKLYSDSLLNESKEKELNALYLTHQKAVNQVLLKENQIAQQKNRFNGLIVFLCAFIIFLLVSLLIILYRNAHTKNKLNKELLNKSANLAERKEKIKQQNSELNELNRTKDQLFSIISHDLRSPFAAIIGTLQLLKDVDLEKDELQYLLDRLYEQTAATAAMTDNLLVWAKSQQGGINVRFDNVLAVDVMREVLSVFQSIAEEKHIKITHTEDQHAYAYADRDHIKIILQNVLANAIKFTPENGAIAISYTSIDGLTCVKIQDSGVGMSPNKVQQLFQKSGSDISTRGTNNETGIGIGLVLVKKFVDANNATLSVNSHENRGTEFIVCFERMHNSSISPSSQKDETG
jgi:signal transduction histidine kinase